jgi:hypothetical protein
MSDLSLGLIVSGVVAVVVLAVGTLTALYCRWVERTSGRRPGGSRS